MLTLYRGDDYAGQLGKTLTIHLSLDAGLPIEGLKAVLEFYDIKKEFTPIQYENDFTVEVSHNQSKKYPLGVSYAKLYCVDSSGKIRTFCNRIPICVTTDLRKVYGSDGLDKQDVHVYALVHWDNIAGKPDYYPTTIEEVEGLEEALRQAGKVKTVNNIEPDENGNIQIDIPSAKVVSVNGKDGVVILNAGDIGYGEDSTVDSALAEAEEKIKTNADSIDSLEQQLEEHIDDTYTKAEVDDKITRFVAHYLTKKDSAGRFVPFATHAELAYAKTHHTDENPQFFYAGESFTPTKNDYCVVLSDESIRTDNPPTTRYSFVGEWPNGQFQYQYTINDTAFSQEQWAAINSLISRDEDGNLVFNGNIIVGFDGTINEEDPIFTEWKNAVQIVLGGNASISSTAYKQIAIGAHATTTAQNAIAIGSSEPGGKTNGPRATAQNAIAVGAGANATAVNAIQILAGTNNTSGTMQIGNKRVAFVSDIPISQADIDDYRYYKGHWDMAVTYKTGDIVRAERTVEGQTEKEVVYFKSLFNNNIAQNPFTSTSYWTRTTDDEGLEKLTLFVKAAIATLTGADIPVSATNTDKIDVALGKKIGQGETNITEDIIIKASGRGFKIYNGTTYASSDTSAGVMADGTVFTHRKSDGRYVEINPSGIKVENNTEEHDISIPLKSGTMALTSDIENKRDKTDLSYDNIRTKYLRTNWRFGGAVTPTEYEGHYEFTASTGRKLRSVKSIRELTYEDGNSYVSCIDILGGNVVQVGVNCDVETITDGIEQTEICLDSSVEIKSEDYKDFDKSYRGIGKMGQVIENPQNGDIYKVFVTAYGTYVYFKSNGTAKSSIGDANWALTFPSNGFIRLTEITGFAIENAKVILLNYEDNVIKRGTETITSFSKFLSLVQTGRVVLMATATQASGSSPTLFRPQLTNGNAVLFDATGEISGVMRTRNINVKRTVTDGIEVVSGGLKTLALTSDLTNLARKSDVPYAVVDTIENRSVKLVTISGSTAMSVVLPKPTATSGVIDFEVWFDASAYTGTYPSIGYKFDATTDADIITKDGEDLAYGDGAVTIVHFTSVNGSAFTAVAASFK